MMKQKVNPSDQSLLTAFDGFGGNLKGHQLATQLRDVNAKHQTHAGVLPPNVRLAVPQFNVRISQL